ncbi:hypothetical protein AVV30_gp024 [Vibrio phage phi 1]|uniref:Uncharacterized protein n=1 Tax=Vibrio phage phi 1 TaxID=1589297 RepID=A0A0B5H2K2_9CAUD|nr:hypothetical protein AVV30_gp024 [Vibrio phage phi 1]AJF40682.1 hypothetical protein SBVP1_0024 [Vibrio phage phi 1]
MKLLKTYNGHRVDFTIWYKLGRYCKYRADNKLGYVGIVVGVDKEHWINVNCYKRIPRKINNQQDSLG